MSKIFNVIEKCNLIDFGEACEPQPHDSMTLPPAVATASIPSRTFSTNGPGRVVQLQILDSSPIFPFDTGNQAAEQYRIIRTKLLHHPRKPQVLVVSSSTTGDGKTVTAINLAA